MATDMTIWRKRAKDECRSIADESFQRLVWFGGGGGQWVDSPTERICKFDDLSIPEILTHLESGLSGAEREQLERLSNLMDELVENTPDDIKPEDLIDDPRWIEIRKQAAITLEALTKEG